MWSKWYTNVSGFVTSTGTWDCWAPGPAPHLSARPAIYRCHQCNQVLNLAYPSCSSSMRNHNWSGASCIRAFESLTTAFEICSRFKSFQCHLLALRLMWRTSLLSRSLHGKPCSLLLHFHRSGEFGWEDFLEPVVHNITEGSDYYLVANDFVPYLEAQVMHTNLFWVHKVPGRSPKLIEPYLLKSNVSLLELLAPLLMMHLSMSTNVSADTDIHVRQPNTGRWTLLNLTMVHIVQSAGVLTNWHMWTVPKCVDSTQMCLFMCLFMWYNIVQAWGGPTHSCKFSCSIYSLVFSPVRLVSREAVVASCSLSGASMDEALTGGPMARH